MGIVKAPPVVAFDIAFRRRAFGQDHLMRLEFEVEILDPVDRFGLHDAEPVDEVFGRDHNLVEA
jgi:hypothetical protein